MKSSRFMLSCLVAACAVLGVIASSASAVVTPTWYECAKAVPKNTGNFNDKLCTEANEGGTGKYVLKEGIGRGKELKGKAVGPSSLHVKTWLGDNTVTCEKSKSNGKPALPNLEKEVTISFSKCVALGTKTCTSPGAKKGEIKLTGLKGELGYIEESPVSVGLKLESEANPGPTGELVFFECEGLTAKITGGVIGVVQKDINTVSKLSETTYVATESIGEHEFETFKYTPVVNILGWASEKVEIEKEIEEDLKGEIAKIVRPILKGTFCGKFIEGLLNKECTPEAYAGLDGTVGDKGEALMIKA